MKIPRPLLYLAATILSIAALVLFLRGPFWNKLWEKLPSTLSEEEKCLKEAVQEMLILSPPLNPIGEESTSAPFQPSPEKPPLEEALVAPIKEKPFLPTAPKNRELTIPKASTSKLLAQKSPDAPLFKDTLPAPSTTSHPLIQEIERSFPLSPTKPSEEEAPPGSSALPTTENPELLSPQETPALLPAPSTPLLCQGTLELPIPKPATNLVEKELEVSSEEKAPPSLPPIESYHLPETAYILDWSDYFSLDVQVALNPEGLQAAGKKYLFSLTLVPDPLLESKRMRQNFTFILDKTAGKDRYTHFKKATLQVLSSLKAGDFFNIILFDKKISRLNAVNLPLNAITFQKAQDFLNQEAPEGTRAPSNLYLALEKILPPPQKIGEAHTALLFSDGKSALNPTALAQWTAKNNGATTLYTASASQDNNLLLLHLLSTCNRGELLYSQTYAAFPRKLIKRIQELRVPLLKDLTASLSPCVNTPENAATLSPPSAHLPTVFLGKPYLLLGSSPSSGEYDLVLRGRYKEQWVEIRKRIFFQEILEASKSTRHAPLDLLRQEKAQALHAYYDLFLKEKNPFYLEQAEFLFKRYSHEISREIPRQKAAVIRSLKETSRS